MTVPASVSFVPTLLERLDAVAEKVLTFQRVAIGGGPLTGKSRIVKRLLDNKSFYTLPIATDDFIHVTWGAQPLAIIAECERHTHFVLSGVQVARCLRAGLEVDCVIWCSEPLERLHKGQVNMTKGVETIFRSWVRGNKTVAIFYP